VSYRIIRNKEAQELYDNWKVLGHSQPLCDAFEKVTGKPIIVPPHFDVIGAIGMAIIARETLQNGKTTRFKGFEVSKVPFTTDKFVCKECSNNCEIRRVRIEGEKKGQDRMDRLEQSLRQSGL